MRLRGDSLDGKTVVISGSGNVAIYACEKAQVLGAKVVAMYDSDGYIYDANGIDLEVVRRIKEEERGRIKEYAARVSGAVYTPGCKGIWTIPCDVALPCATQNEIDAESAAILVKNGVKYVAEGREYALYPGSRRHLQTRGRRVSSREGGKCGRRRHLRFGNGAVFGENVLER